MILLFFLPSSQDKPLQSISGNSITHKAAIQVHLTKKNKAVSKKQNIVFMVVLSFPKDTGNIFQSFKG